ncbi:MAG: DsbA family protein [Anaerolineae bacterium]|nr:DsbA family protein [Anaerolineae bacterium]
MPELIKLYVDTGRVRYIFRDYPQSGIHTSAVRQAHAAHCAAEQNRYWEMHDLLYDKVDLFIGIREADFTLLDEFAQNLGLNREAFEECMESRRYLDRITQDFEAARALGIRATPAYVLNGEILFGLYPTGAWQKMIERKLAEAGKPVER